MSGKVDIWMPLYVDDYDRATSRLSLAEDGAYGRLIRDYWCNGAPPDDDDRLSSIVRTSRREWLKLRPVLARYFDIKGGFWHHKRVEAELERAEKNREARAKNGAKGGRPRKLTETEEKAAGYVQPKLNETPLPSPSPLPTEAISEATASSAGSGKPKPPKAELLAKLIEGATTGRRPKWQADPIFVAAWNACSAEMRNRSVGRAKTWPVWARAAMQAGGPDVLLAALRAYLAGDKDLQRTGGPGFHLWLKDGKWEHWIDRAAEDATPAVTWPGPADLRAAIVTAKDEAWARSYIDRSTWRDLPSPALIPTTSFAAKVIASEVGAILRQAGVTIEVERAA